MSSRFPIPFRVVLIAALAACGGGGATSGSDAPPPPVAGGPIQAAPGGRVITVEMLTDDQGNNIFRPSQVDAKKGDVLRYTLVTGVHNVNFLPDSNPSTSGLPKAADMLQAPGQTFDVLVSMDGGRYYFQCDPHALLKMVGHVTVVPG